MRGVGERRAGDMRAVRFDLGATLIESAVEPPQCAVRDRVVFLLFIFGEGLLFFQGMCVLLV